MRDHPLIKPTRVRIPTVLKDESGKVVGALEIYTDTTELDHKDVKIRELLALLNKDTGFHDMVGHKTKA